MVGCTDTSAVPTPRARAAEVRSRDREGIKIEIKTHSRSEDEVQKILADCDLHNTIRQQEAHLHHDVAPEEGAADALRPYFLFFVFVLLPFRGGPTHFREGPCLPDGYLNTNYNKQRAIRLLQPLPPTLATFTPPIPPHKPSLRDIQPDNPKQPKRRPNSACKVIYRCTSKNIPGV